MTKRQDPRQFDLFAPPPPPPPPERLPDRMAERIVEAGIAPNAIRLSMDRSIGGGWGSNVELPYPWSLPSRMFIFPIEFRGGEGKGDGWISVRHEGLLQHPGVIAIGEKLGEPVPWRRVDEFGRPLEALPQWWHAVDLMDEKHWRDLLETPHFTDSRCIMRAVAHSLQCPAGHEGSSRKVGRISVNTARSIMEWLGCTEPEDRSRTALVSDRLRPSKIEERNGKGKVTATRWPLNLHLGNAEDEAWATIHGLEDGWFHRSRAGFVEWAELGRKRHAGDAEELAV